MLAPRRNSTLSWTLSWKLSSAPSWILSSTLSWTLSSMMDDVLIRKAFDLGSASNIMLIHETHPRSGQEPQGLARMANWPKVAHGMDVPVLSARKVL